MVRESKLLDEIEKLEQVPLDEHCWRGVHAGRDPLECAQAGGRWDDTTFNVLYTSLAPEGAVAEIVFHLRRGQPIVPSMVNYQLYELSASLSQIIRFDDLAALASVGINTQSYGRGFWVNRVEEYPQSQHLAETCHFLGVQGIVVPNARHNSLNLVVFCDQEPTPEISVVSGPQPIPIIQ